MDLHILRGSEGLVPHLKSPSWHFMPKIQNHSIYSLKGGLGFQHIIILGGHTIISCGDPYHFKWPNGLKYHNFRVMWTKHYNFQGTSSSTQTCFGPTLGVLRAFSTMGHVTPNSWASRPNTIFYGFLHILFQHFLVD